MNYYFSVQNLISYRECCILFHLNETLVKIECLFDHIEKN